MGNDRDDREMHDNLTTPDVFCGTCSEKIQSRHKFVNCALCKSKIHIKCNHIEYNTYNKMNKKKEISIVQNVTKTCLFITQRISSIEILTMNFLPQKT